MGRKRDFRDAAEFHAKPPTSSTHVCKLYWPPKAGDDDSESGEASSARTGDGEEPWYDATWSWGGSGFGPHWDGAIKLASPEIEPTTGLEEVCPSCKKREEEAKRCPGWAPPPPLC